MTGSFYLGYCHNLKVNYYERVLIIRINVEIVGLKKNVN